MQERILTAMLALLLVVGFVFSIEALARPSRSEFRASVDAQVFPKHIRE